MASQLFKRARDLWTGGNEPEARPVTVKKVVNQHHAVSVVPGVRSCAAAQALEGRRFLSREAPILPLKGCTRGECDCRYEHHADRRKGPRRARDMGVAVDGYEGDDQRLKQKRGRRKTDKT